MRFLSCAWHFEYILVYSRVCALSPCILIFCVFFCAELPEGTAAVVVATAAPPPTGGGSVSLLRFPYVLLGFLFLVLENFLNFIFIFGFCHNRNLLGFFVSFPCSF